MEIQGTTGVYGVIGRPIAHTFSPLIHNTLAELLDEEMVYTAFPAEACDTPEEMEHLVKGAFNLGILGLNVTVPYKSMVIPHLAAIDPMAEQIGAVNTLVRTENGFAGYNTDLEGLGRALDEKGFAVEGRDVVILGAGGAARAACFLAGSKGASGLWILNRTIERADALAADVRQAYPGMPVHTGLLSKAGDVDARDFLAIQCTKIGMHPDTEGIPTADPTFYEKLACAYDVVYNPAETEFIRRVRAEGKPGSTGLDMLLFQAFAAFTHWTGKEVDAATGREASARLRSFLHLPSEESARPASVVLTGFMGSGKSTTAAFLSALTGLRVLDTDSAIEENAGMTVSEIFAREGEQGFRDRETALLRSLAGSGKSGFIYATGGGIVLREENRRLLKQMGTVVLLSVRPETVLDRLAGDFTRPLLAGDDREEKVSALLKSREAAYADAADQTVVCDGLGPDEIAAAIVRLTGIS